MASTKQAKRILNQGRKIATSASNKRTRPISESDGRPRESDDSQEEPSQEMSADRSGKKDKRQKVIQPNAFLSFRITNHQIIDRASEVQQQIIASNPLLSKASVSIPTLHVTLMVFALKTDEDKQRARQSLIDVCQQIATAKLPSPQITFTGLSHFNNKVLYVDPVRDAHLDVLERIAVICRTTYEKNGIASTDVRPFNPHLTLFKLSKARDLHRKGVKKIDQCWTSTYSNHHFGVENFQVLHLCNMLKKQNDGYYEIFHEQHLFNDALSASPLLPDKPIDVTDVVAFPSIHNNASLERVPIDPITNNEPTALLSSIMDESAPLLRSDRAVCDDSASETVTSTSRSTRSQGCCSCCSIL